MNEPVYEFDYPEPYRRPPVWFPKKAAFNLYEAFRYVNNEISLL